MSHSLGGRMIYETPEIEHSERIDVPLVLGVTSLPPGLTVTEDPTEKSN
jgi:hypothetical protein